MSPSCLEQLLIASEPNEHCSRLVSARYHEMGSFFAIEPVQSSWECSRSLLDRQDLAKGHP